MSLFEKVFKEKGINMTSSRRALFQVLENSKNHLTVDEILNMLCELGLIEKHEFPNLEPAYEKVSGKARHHHHIIDMGDGAVTEFAADELDAILEKIAAAHGYKMLGHKIEIYGEKTEK